ncbi:hydroxylase [Catellatospora sp. TT07R-123]|uniref:VOC family protein n=1 Tax=Catellatospora sp. TT07R-123 TaxID=2733863 RepID=UPI001B0FFCB1|nr:VOC family protein [Catellatospora sp. TT07R-123]GHJ45117.1 hydroxylase [Catellatospora sp. TT07R-123]
MRVRGYAPATPCWAEYAAADVAGATAFYAAMFGWEPGEVFSLDGRAVAGIRPGTPGRPSAWLGYVSVVSADDAAVTVADAGGAVLAGPSDIGPRGRTALCADAEGAVFGLWQKGSFGGAELANEPDTQCWTEVVARDESAAVSFYGKAFGWSERKGEIVEGVPYIEWLKESRTVGGLSVMDARYPLDAPAHWRVTFEVSDCARAVARCRELGGQVLTGPLEMPVGNYAILADPQGGMFAIIELSELVLETMGR